VAIAAVAAGTASSWYLSHQAAATAGQLSATASHLDDARSTLAAREAALASLQAALNDAREGATKTATEAALSRHRAEDLGGQVARLQAERQALQDQLEQAELRGDWGHLLSGAPLLGTSW
jgi:septal ring factor EnvC (AmiA/AmiB activator)